MEDKRRSCDPASCMAGVAAGLALGVLLAFAVMCANRLHCRNGECLPAD